MIIRVNGVEIEAKQLTEGEYTLYISDEGILALFSGERPLAHYTENSKPLQEMMKTLMPETWALLRANNGE